MPGDKAISVMSLLSLLAQLDEFEVVDKSDLTDGAGGTNKRITYELLVKAFMGPDGVLVNGKLSPSVAANDLTLAIKTLAGSDPSATDPVFVKIDGTVRTITAALSVTKADGTDWAALGTICPALEVDLFAYLGYNATDGVTIGWSRIPYGHQYSDFSITTTNEKYCAISNIANAAAANPYVVVGRFAATLSAGAGYTWSVPAYTPRNLVQRPIFETRVLTYVSTNTRVTTPYTNAPGSVTTRYQVIGRQCRFVVSYVQNAVPGGTGQQRTTSPFDSEIANIQFVTAQNWTTKVTFQATCGTGAPNKTWDLWKYDGTSEATASQWYTVFGQFWMTAFG